MLFRSLPYKTKQFFLVLIKLSIVIGAFYFIYKKLAENAELDFSIFLQFLEENDSFSLKMILFLIFLSLFNWFLEISKWKILVSSVRNISFKNAMEQCLGSLTASILTPNRIGEYGAKAIYFESGERKKIIVLNLFGNIMQMTTTCIFGIAGLILMYSTYDLPIDLYRALKFVVIISVIGVITLLGLKRVKVKGYSLDQLKTFFQNIPKQTIVSGMILSIFRYLVFSFQFFFLLTLFGIQVEYKSAMVVITSMYLLSSVIPSIFIFDVVIKGSVAVFLFSVVSVNNFTTLSIVTLMWLLNFVLPSVFGSYYVLNFNLQKPIQR
ncbi:MAG: flippase-like domain-containing protein [Psychroserpens sp.]|nr:flippase-like domain-containing protein [Psychroserpens sp.]